MNELIKVEPKDVLTVFTEEGALNQFIDVINKTVAEFKHDMSTPSGRAKTASLANKVARSKTYLDGLGKDLVGGWKAKAKTVDNNRKQMRDELDEIKESARLPLTQWEEADKLRIMVITERIEQIQRLAVGTSAEGKPLSSEGLKENLTTVIATIIDASFDEYKAKVSEAKETAISALNLLIESKIKYENEKAELLRLRKEAEELRQQLREEQQRKEAEELQTKKAEEMERIESGKTVSRSIQSSEFAHNLGINCGPGSSLAKEREIKEEVIARTAPSEGYTAQGHYSNDSAPTTASDVGFSLSPNGETISGLILYPQIFIGRICQGEHGFTQKFGSTASFKGALNLGNGTEYQVLFLREDDNTLFFAIERIGAFTFKNHGYIGISYIMEKLNMYNDCDTANLHDFINALLGNEFENKGRYHAE